MHNLRKHAETAALAAAGGLALWLLLDRKNLGTAIGAIGGAVSGGLQDLGTSMGKYTWDKLSYDWSKHPDEAQWECPYWTEPKYPYRVFYGAKPRLKLFHKESYEPGAHMPPEARIQVNLALYLTAPNIAGRLRPRPGAGMYTLHYQGGKSGSLTGDPRFLYCLDHLMRIANMDRLDHDGVQPGPNSVGDFGHGSGCAIDLRNDLQFNRLLEAAKVAKMPVAWISKSHVPGKGWPIFVLQNGIKTGPFTHTKINHNSHFHVILPRPNWAQNYWNNA